MLLIAAVLFGVVACKPEGELPSLTEDDIKTFQNYMGAFGHVRVLGDLDHVLKGEKVDDEPGVTVQTMAAGTVTVGKDSIVIPLTLTKYDYDGHRNPEDPNPELYTRIATGTVTLTLNGAMNAEGTAYLLLHDAETLPEYITPEPDQFFLPAQAKHPKPSEWTTLRINRGKRDKLSKGDVAGFLYQKGGLTRDEVGVVEVFDSCALAAIKRDKKRELLARIRPEKIKNKNAK